MSEADALARLSTDSPRVRAIRSGIELARADVLSANRWPNPRLYVGRESVAGVTETITSVLQPLPITGQRRLKRRRPRRSSRPPRIGRTRRCAVRAPICGLRTRIVTAQTRERELTTARDHLQELVGILEKRERAGDAAAFDRLRAQREVIDFEADRVLASADRARPNAASPRTSRRVRIPRPLSLRLLSSPRMICRLSASSSTRLTGHAVRRWRCKARSSRHGLPSAPPSGGAFRSRRCWAERVILCRGRRRRQRDQLPGSSPAVRPRWARKSARAGSGGGRHGALGDLSHHAARRRLPPGATAALERRAPPTAIARQP